MTEQARGDLGRELERMFGPVGPELGCDECFDRLDAYVELELTGVSAGAGMPAMRAHFEGCPACRDEHDSLLAFVRADPEGAVLAATSNTAAVSRLVMIAAAANAASPSARQ